MQWRVEGCTAEGYSCCSKTTRCHCILIQNAALLTVSGVLPSGSSSATTLNDLAKFEQGHGTWGFTPVLPYMEYERSKELQLELTMVDSMKSGSQSCANPRVAWLAQLRLD